MSPANFDRNLLFGVLALQMDFLGRDALIAAMHAWILDKAKPLGVILVEQRALRIDERDLLDALVQKHLDHHRGDVEKSLAAVSVPTPLRDELRSLADADVQASLDRLPTPSAQAEPGPLPSTTGEVKSVAGLRYQILRPHDKGGIGEVFVALDQELNRQVALKEIQERHAGDSRSLGRFVREAEITGGLEHPGIVPVYGLGQYADGRPFYAMRFIQGETLKDAITKFHAGDPGVTLRGLLTRFVAVCNTIAYAHSRGVIHRDLKPSNIMLGKYGETLVVDWGMAKAGVNEPARSDSDGLPEPTLTPLLADGIQTQAGMVLGTPPYMSPEQAAGRLDLLGPASDIYSLGATLYTLLTDRPPVEGKDTAELLRKAQRGEWLPPRRVKPDMPPALDAVCRKAMAAAPSERYDTALELAADMERWLADEPVAAYREPWAVRSRRWMRRHRTLVSTAAGVLVIALLNATVGLAILGDAWDKEAAARKKAENKEREAQEQKEQARFSQYVAQMNLVQRDYEDNNIGRVRELLEAQVPREEGATDRRGFEWYYWQRMAHRELLTFKPHPQGVLSVAFSPDGRRLATAGGEKTVRVWDAASGKEVLALKGHTSYVFNVTFSTDGRRLATASDDRTVPVWDAATGKELLCLQGHTNVVRGVAFSSDGRRLATASTDRTVRFWDASTGTELFRLKGHPDEIHWVVFSPDCRRLATASKDRLGIWDAATGTELFTIKIHVNWTNNVAFSPDGQRLASASDDRAIGIWDAVTGKELLTLNGHTGWVCNVAFSADGRKLASASADGTARVWDAATGQELLNLKGHTSGAWGMALRPDGRRLATASQDQTVRIWDASTGQELLTFKRHLWGVRSAAFSPDGRRLASSGGDQTVRVWDASTGQELLTLKGHTHVVFNVAFSPDGRRLASASADQTVRVWDAATGKELLTLKGHTNYVHRVAFSPDGRHLASASGDNTVRVWDTSTGKVLLILKEHPYGVCCVAFSPDGRRLATAGESKGIGEDPTVRIWDASTGQELLTLKGHPKGVTSVAFSADGRRLASTGGDQAVRIWDASTGEEQLTLKGHTSWTYDVAFSPDGRRLASASADRTVRVWDAATGKELLTLKGHTSYVSSVAFSPDGWRLASAGDDRTVRFWEATPVPDAVWRQRDLVSQVTSLFEKHLLREDVLTILRKDPTLSEADRSFALQAAQTCSEDLGQVHEAAWRVIKTSGAGNDAYALALRRAEAASRLAPENRYFLHTLGAAQYRAGHHAEALDTLTKVPGLNAEHLAFLAMTQHRLGQKSQARETLGRMREMLNQRKFHVHEAEAVSLLREAEMLIEDKQKDKKP